MKYLKIHVLLWWILCFLWLSFEVLYFMLLNLIYFTCTLKTFSWSSLYNNYEKYFVIEYYKDKTPIDTYVRYCKIINVF